MAWTYTGVTGQASPGCGMIRMLASWETSEVAAGREIAPPTTMHGPFV